jgi:hypothetical protein
VRMVKKTMQPVYISLWLRPPVEVSEGRDEEQPR